MCQFPQGEISHRMLTVSSSANSILRDQDVFFFTGMRTSPDHLAFTGCHRSIHQTCLCPEGCFLAFLWLLETPLKARSISGLTVTEPSSSPILSLEIYRDHKRLVGNPLASTFGLQSVSFKRQNATEDHLAIWFLHFLGLGSSATLPTQALGLVLQNPGLGMKEPH